MLTFDFCICCYYYLLWLLLLLLLTTDMPYTYVQQLWPPVPWTLSTITSLLDCQIWRNDVHLSIEHCLIFENKLAGKFLLKVVGLAQEGVSYRYQRWTLSHDTIMWYCAMFRGYREQGQVETNRFPSMWTNVAHNPSHARLGTCRAIFRATSFGRCHVLTRCHAIFAPAPFKLSSYQAMGWISLEHGDSSKFEGVSGSEGKSFGSK